MEHQTVEKKVGQKAGLTAGQWDNLMADQKAGMWAGKKVEQMADHWEHH